MSAEALAVFVSFVNTGSSIFIRKVAIFRRANFCDLQDSISTYDSQ
jgi:hypothetical protein